MEGLTIIETKVLQQYIKSLEDLKLTVMSTIAELKETKSPYMTAQELMDFTKFKKDWVNDNKQLIGYRMVSGQLRFRRSDVIDFMEQNYFKSKKRK